LTFALASCQYPAGLVDRAPANASYARLAALLALNDPRTKPQLLLLMGDQVYVDETAGLFTPAAVDSVGFAYEQNFQLEAFRCVTRQLPTYAVLDDHEVQDNWEPGSLPANQETEALDAYRFNQFKWVAGAKQPIGSYAFESAGFGFFVLDTRSHRERRVARPTPGAVLLQDALIASPVDTAALAAWLAAGESGVPQFVVSPVALVPVQRCAIVGQEIERIALDDWAGYPKSQFDMLLMLYEKAVGTIVVLSGDRHMSSVSSLWMDGSRGPVEIISVVSSGLYAPWPFANSRPDEFWLEGRFTMNSTSAADGPRSIGGKMATAAVGTTNGFGRVRVERSSAGAWVLRVTLDLEEGLLSRQRTLGDAADTDWKIVAG